MVSLLVPTQAWESSDLNQNFKIVVYNSISLSENVDFDNEIDEFDSEDVKEPVKVEQAVKKEAQVSQPQPMKKA